MSDIPSKRLVGIEPKGRLFSYQPGVPPEISRAYDATFKPSASYLKELPDMGLTVGAIEGSQVEIQQVGVSGFSVPLRFDTSSGAREIEARVSGFVSLAFHLKGINMSRLLRTFYAEHGDLFHIDAAAHVAQRYIETLGSSRARLRVAFRYPSLLSSLRSGLHGWQYYDAAYLVDAEAGKNPRRFMELDFIYSSACPCSAELVEHARAVRGVYGVPHSQRSIARLKVELCTDVNFTLDDLIDHARIALSTETQVLVKREDEQAFAELNGSHLKFVEDAARLIHQTLIKDDRLYDFQAICVHMESLHSHDAVSVICRGQQGGYPPFCDDLPRSI